MAEPGREVGARAAVSEKMTQKNKVSVMGQQQQQQQQQQLQQQQQRFSSDEALQLEEEVQLARESIVWMARRIASLPVSRSFLDLTLALLSAVWAPSLYYKLMAPWHYKLRHPQSLVVRALKDVTEEDLAAYVESLVRGNKEICGCRQLLLLIPDSHGLQSNKGAVIIRDAFERECERTRVAEEEEWAQERLEDAMYREYMKEKEAALAGMPAASVVSARAFRSRSHSPKRGRSGRTASPRRSRSLTARGQEVEPSDEAQLPTLLDDESYDVLFIADPPEPLVPPFAARPSSQESIVEQAIGYDSTTCSEGNPLGVKKPASLSSSTEGASPTPPLTPPLMSPRAFATQSRSVEPPLLQLRPATPPTRSPQRTYSTNPLGAMFSPAQDKSGVIFVVKDLFCSERVMNDRPKAARVLRELEDGCVRAETLEWIVRGLRSPRGKRELAQRHDGLEFVGPQWGAPMYKTRSGVGRLLRGVAGKHEAGTKFVVCTSSTSSNGATNVRMITGILSHPSEPSGWPTPNKVHHVQPVMDGEVPELQEWVNTCGNLDDGCRLWAWVY